MEFSCGIQLSALTSGSNEGFNETSFSLQPIPHGLFLATPSTVTHSSLQLKRNVTVQPSVSTDIKQTFQ